MLRPHNRNSVHVELENKIDTSNNRGNWNYFKITQTVPEKHTKKAGNKGTKKKKPYWALHTYCGKS